MLLVSPKEAKTDERHQSSGKLISFVRGEEIWPLEPKTLFYDYIYMNALLENKNAEVMIELIEDGYSAFSDLATLSLNSQARNCAIFVGLYRAGLLDEIKNKEFYLRLFRTKEDGTAAPKAYENAQKHIQPDTSNQVVRGSNLRWLTNQNPLKRSV